MKMQKTGTDRLASHWRSGRVNGRLALILLVSLAASGVAVHVLHGRMLKKNASNLLGRSERLLAEAKTLNDSASANETAEDREKRIKGYDKKRRDAVRYLRQYLQLEPDDTQAWITFVFTSDEISTTPRQRREVFEQFLAALRRLEAPDSDEQKEQIQNIRRRLVDIAVDLTRYFKSDRDSLINTALQEIATLEKNDEQLANDGELLLVKGRCLEFQRKWRDAAEVFERSTKNDPENLGGYLALMRMVINHPSEIKYREYDPSDRENPTIQMVADTIAEQMAKVGKPTYRALLQQAQYYRQQAGVSTEEQLRRDALKSAKEKIVLSVQAQQTLIESAAKSVDAADPAEIDPEKIDPVTDIQPELSAAEIFRALSRVMRQAGDAQAGVELMKSSLEYAQAARKRNPTNPSSYGVLAQMESSRVSSGFSPNPDYSKAIEYLRDGLAQIEESDVSRFTIKQNLSWMLANMLIVSGEWTDDFQKGDRTPEFRELLLSLTQLGTPHERIELLEARLKLERLRGADSPANSGVVIYKLIDQLETLHTKLIGDRSLSVQVDHMLGICYRYLGDDDGQFRVYDRAAKLDPLDAVLRFRLAAVLANLGRTAEAIEKLQSISLSIPGVATTAAQLRLQQQLDLPLEARKWDALAAYYEELLTRLEDHDQKHSSDWTAVKLRQAKLHGYRAIDLVDHDPKAADEAVLAGEKLLRAAIAEDPQEPRYWTYLADLRFQSALTQKDEQAAHNIRRQTLEILDEAERQMGPQVDFQVVRATTLAYLELYASQAEEKTESNQAARAERKQQVVQSILALAEGADRFRESGEDKVDRRPELWRGLSLALTKIGEIDKARDFCEQLIEVQPANLSHRLMLLELTISDLRRQLRLEGPNMPTQEEWEQGLAQITDIVEGMRGYEGPTGPSGNYAEGIRLLMELDIQAKQGHANPSEKTLGQARTLMLAAAQQRPNFATIQRGLGHLEELAGNDSAASEHYRRAIDLGDLSQFTVNRAVLLLTKHNRDQEVIDVVEKVKNRAPDMLGMQGGLSASPGMGELAAMAAIREGNLEAAIELYDDVDPEHQSYRYHLRVGQVNLLKARRNKNVAQAKNVEPYFRKATELAPLEADTWMTLVGYLLEAGRTEDAQKEVEQVKEQLTHEYKHIVLAKLYLAMRNRGEAEVQYEAALKQHPEDLKVIQTVSSFLRLAGKTKRAEEIIKQALAMKPDDPVVHGLAAHFYSSVGNRDLARKYLQKILAAGEKAGESRLKAARRTMALLTVSGGSYADYQEARKILQPNLDAERPELVDLTTLLAVLAPQPNREGKLEQIKIFNQLAERQPLSQPQQLRLAKLYEETGNWREARPLLLTLATSENHRAYYISFYVRSLRRHNEFAEAENWLNQLKTLMPNSYVAAILEAEYQAAQNEGAQALKTIQTYLDNDQVVTPEQTFQDLVAEGRVKDALAPLEKYVDSSNDQVAGRILNEAKTLIDKELTEEAAIMLRGVLQRSEMKQSMKVAKYRLAAASLAKLKEYQSAETIYRQYMKLRNEPNDALGLVALVAKQDGRIEEALDLCDKLWETAPPQTVARVSVAALRAGDPTPEQIQRVGKKLEAAIHDNPQSNALLTRLAEFFDLQGRFAETESVYARAAKQNQRNVMALNNLAWILALQDKEGERALGLINTAIKNVGPQAELLDTRGVVFISLKKYDAAITDLQSAVAGSKNPAPKRFHLAQAFLGKGRANYDLARKELQAAIEAGLTEDGLHPLEIPTFQRLLRELKVSTKSSGR